MAGNIKNRGFGSMSKKRVSEIGKMGNRAQPIEAKRKGAENQPHEAKVRGGQNSHRSAAS